MAKQIFVNLPVADLKRSMNFFGELGYAFNPQFTDETAACMVISDDIFAMLLTHERFLEFVPNQICDAKKSTEVLVALSFESRDEVVAHVEKALAAGATRYADPKDYGFMYHDSFQDIDGHIWEIFNMDMKAMEEMRASS